MGATPTLNMLLNIFLLIVICVQLGASLKSRNIKTESRLDTVHLMRIQKTPSRDLQDQGAKNASTCSCANYTCGCCVQLLVEKISLNETGCANISYLPDEYGFEFLFTLNGKAIIDRKVSVKNPPPICADIPYVHQLASLCIRFHDLDFKSKQFSGCADIEVELEGVVIKDYDLGCFHVPPSLPTVTRQTDVW